MPLDSIKELEVFQPIERTRAGILLDVLSRLPNVDRQRGKVFGRKVGITEVLIRWCTTPPANTQGRFKIVPVDITSAATFREIPEATLPEIRDVE